MISLHVVVWSVSYLLICTTAYLHPMTEDVKYLKLQLLISLRLGWFYLRPKSGLLMFLGVVICYTVDNDGYFGN